MQVNLNTTYISSISRLHRQLFAQAYFEVNTYSSKNLLNSARFVSLTMGIFFVGVLYRGLYMCLV